jgi:hypothetical protein
MENGEAAPTETLIVETDGSSAKFGSTPDAHPRRCAFNPPTNDHTLGRARSHFSQIVAQKKDNKFDPGTIPIQIFTM